MSDLAIIMVLHNASRTLPRCLATLKQQVGLSLSISMIDNASTDESFAIARDFSQSLAGASALSLPRNEGYTAAANKAAALVQAPFLLFLNPDIYLSSAHALQQSLSECLTAGYDIAASPQCNPDGTSLAIAHPVPTARLLFTNKIIRRKDTAYDYSPKWFEGGALWVRQSTYQSLNGFDEIFLQYGEDLDFCYRAHKMGFSLGQLKQAPFTHDRFIANHTQKRTAIGENYVRFFEKHAHYTAALGAKLWLAWLRVTA